MGAVKRKKLGKMCCQHKLFAHTYSSLNQRGSGAVFDTRGGEKWCSYQRECVTSLCEITTHAHRCLTCRAALRPSDKMSRIPDRSGNAELNVPSN